MATPSFDLCDSQAMYELASASGHPTVDLARTLLSYTCLSVPTQAMLTDLIETQSRLMYTIVRLALIVFTLLVFIPSKLPGAFIVISVVSVLTLFVATPPLLALLALSAVDVVALLLRTYECWFVSIINTIHWVCVARILGLPRGILCIVGWLSIQSIAMIDANFYAFSAASKAAITTIPLLLVLAIACGSGIVPDAQFTLIYVSRDFPIDTGSVVAFTSSTLAIFMAKKVYVTRHQLRECELSLARFRVVCCVVLKGRLRLRPWRSGRRVAIQAGTRLRHGATMNRLLSGNTQPVRGSSHWSTSFVIDVKRTLVPVMKQILSCNARKSLILRVGRCFICLVGVTGFVSSVGTWLLLLLPRSDCLDGTKLQLGVVAVAFSHVYILACFALSHRDMLLALITNFDVMFSEFQMHALAVCMMDLMQWRPHGCAAVAAWWLWFNWIFLLDAMTPPVQAFVRLRRGFPLAVTTWVLAITVVVMALIFADSELFTDRNVWTVQWLGARAYELHTKDFAMQRVATILGWNTRLAIELARPKHTEELLFLRQPLEYSCPVAFPQSVRSVRGPSLVTSMAPAGLPLLSSPSSRRQSSRRSPLVSPIQ